MSVIPGGMTIKCYLDDTLVWEREGPVGSCVLECRGVCASRVEITCLPETSPKVCEHLKTFQACIHPKLADRTKRLMLNGLSVWMGGPFAAPDPAKLLRDVPKPTPTDKPKLELTLFDYLSIARNMSWLCHGALSHMQKQQATGTERAAMAGHVHRLAECVELIDGVRKEEWVYPQLLQPPTTVGMPPNHSWVKLCKIILDQDPANGITVGESSFSPGSIRAMEERELDRAVETNRPVKPGD